jgi:hypothetical protein
MAIRRSSGGCSRPRGDKANHVRLMTQQYVALAARASYTDQVTCESIICNCTYT